MNDFLTRVVRRHRGELSTVRPRVAPLFAPRVEPAVDPWSGEVTWSERATAPAPDPMSGETPERGATPTSEAEPVKPPRVLVATRLVEVPSPAGRPGGETASREPRASVRTQERRPDDGEHRPVPERIATPPASPTERRAPSNAVTALTHTTVTERVTRTERVEVIPRLVPQAIPAARPIEAPPSLVAPISRQGVHGVDADTAEPPVQVTIGRIEVTAMAAPPAPKRKTGPRPPSMSLQEYLARRQDKGASR